MKPLFVICSLTLIACSRTPDPTAAAKAAGTAAATPAPAPTRFDAQPVSTSGTAANAPAAPAGVKSVSVREVTIPAGTVLPIDLETPVGSDISRPEQQVRGRLRRAVTVHGVQVLPAGTEVLGNVTAARRPGRVKGRGYVALRFNELQVPGEGRTHITTSTVARMAPATKGKDAIEILAPAAGGAVLGRVLGGKKAAREGAVIGGAAGTGYVLSTRGKEVRLGKGANLNVNLKAPVSVRVR
jgi:hypothetical protein